MLCNLPLLPPIDYQNLRNTLANLIYLNLIRTEDDNGFAGGKSKPIFLTFERHLVTFFFNLTICISIRANLLRLSDNRNRKREKEKEKEKETPSSIDAAAPAPADAATYSDHPPEPVNSAPLP
ncbi:hypothetical protein Q3G72_022805 [Acer saccharum]|nr:hypothetical protein Q3G72_022805 [Acer saccharum]